MTHKKIQIDNTIYEANLDFRIALKCNEIAKDTSIGNFERCLGIICTLFGAKALENPKHYDRLLSWTLKYLSFGIEMKANDKEPDMDYEQDKKYIKSSFKYDYNYDPYEKDFLSWEDFYNDLNNLSNNDFNCCILNRVRNLRNYDTKKIKDPEERRKVEEAKKMVALKRTPKEKHFNEQQIKNMEEFCKQMGL